MQQPPISWEEILSCWNCSTLIPTDLHWDAPKNAVTWVTIQKVHVYIYLESSYQQQMQAMSTKFFLFYVTYMTFKSLDTWTLTSLLHFHMISSELFKTPTLLGHDKLGMIMFQTCQRRCSTMSSVAMTASVYIYHMSVSCLHVITTALLMPDTITCHVRA